MRFIGAIMLMAAAGFFTDGSHESFVAGIAFFTGGLWLLTRQKPQSLPPAPPETESRLHALESDVLLLTQELARTREGLAEITAERDFLRQLYPGVKPGDARHQSLAADYATPTGSTTSKTVGFPSA